MYNIDRLWWKVCFPILFRGLFSSAFEGAPALFSRFRCPGTSSSGSPEKWWKYIQWGCASEFFSTVRSRGWLRAGFQELVGGPGPWIGRWTCRHGNVISLTVTEFPGGFNFTKGRKEVFFPVPKPIAGCIGKKRRKRKRRVPLPSGHLRSRPARSQCFCERDIFSMLTRFSSEPGCGTAAAGSWKRTSFLSCRNSPCTSWANHKSMVPWLRSFWTLQKYKSPWRPPSVRGILNKKQGKHSKYPWLKKHFGTRNQAEFPLRDL